ncbi:DUF3710 domain-containing protein [Actinocrinis puniceicyclus]|uniref:DUF3710 domain-containing protein n=1 Tax=Actinocrinis puniceicyclus TaxID=977794 RepID=A0A8J7WRF7_9ACTN|nr:DUF3710 domain-containing protein [Actinocrinis puniceicyclus]MBS2964039.1 DUF3710 domain-containing protein [Actinocrinis puniceicyclus]
MFRRRGRDAGQEPEDGFDESADDVYEDAQSAARPTPEPGSGRENGPWDAAELDDPQEGRIDFGGLLIPAAGNIRVEMTEQGQLVAIRVELGQSALQVNAFAAPRSEGIWAEVCDEIAVEITKQGGIVDRGVGQLGPELRARVPVRLPDGNQGMQVMRFLGADGPRWFLRGVVYGLGAVQPEAAAAVDRVFREIVVVRGTEAMAPRDPIPMEMPKNAQPAEQPPAEEASPYSGGLNPFERGPEITEVR